MSTVTDFQFAVGNGAQTAFTIMDPSGSPASAPVVTSLFRKDWRGKITLSTTPRTNLCLQSEDFSTTWIPSGVTVAGTTNVAVAPDGTLTADQLVEDTGTTVHGLNQTITSTGVASSISVYVKAGTRRRILIRESTITGASVSFDVISGTVLNQNIATGSISDAGDGWWRCTLLMTPTAGAHAWSLYLLPDAGTIYADATYTGNVANNIYLWGAQVEESATPTAYHKTVGSTDTVTDYSVAGSVATLSPAPVAGATLSWTGTDSNGPFIPGHSGASAASAFAGMGAR